jgi:hypothetical protein
MSIDVQVEGKLEDEVDVPLTLFPAEMAGAAKKQ